MVLLGVRHLPSWTEEPAAKSSRLPQIRIPWFPEGRSRSEGFESEGKRGRPLTEEGAARGWEAEEEAERRSDPAD